MENARGFFDGTWYTEEHMRAARLGLRVEERLHQETSPFQEIAVYATSFFGRLLTLDGLVMLTERDEFVYHEMLAHVPLCSLPHPGAVLVIGGGDCGILREVVKHPTVERAVLCEIDERVTRVCEDWFPWVRPVVSDPRVELIFDDGVRYIESHRGQFDLIVIDSTDPVGPAAGLFRRSFYARAAEALRPGGVLVAQTESPHWAAGLVAGIYAGLRQSFRHVHAYMGQIPTYPSGSWCWAYASNDRAPETFFDADRALAISRTCLYYTPELQRAAFQLPGFARRAVDGENVFERFDVRARSVREAP